MSLKIVLSKDNASTEFLMWKQQVENILKAKPLPKNFVSVKTLKTTVYITSLYDFLVKDVPEPSPDAYILKEDEFQVVYQKYLNAMAQVKLSLQEVLSEALYQAFAAEVTCYEGYKQVLLEVQFDEAQQLRILKRKLEMICQQNHQSVKEYADDVNLILLQLSALKYPPVKFKEDFESDLAERFLGGMKLEESKSYRVIFVQQNASVFAEMRRIINLEYQREEQSRAQRSSILSETEEKMSALSINNLEATILKIMKQVKAEEKTPLTDEEDHKIFVGMLNPQVSEQQVEAAFKQFGTIEKVIILRHPDGMSKKCGFVTFKDKFAADSAVRKDKKITVCGGVVTVSKALKKQIKHHHAYFSARSNFSGIVDSGCAPNHLSPDVGGLENVTNSDKFSLGIANGSIMISDGKRGDFNSDTLTIKGIEGVAGISNTLLSVYAFMKDGKDIWFDSKSMTVNIGHLSTDGNHKVLARGEAKNGVFEINLKHATQNFAAPAIGKSWDLWHWRCMHYGHKILRNTYNSGAVRGFKVPGKSRKSKKCDSCIQGKMQRMHHPPSRFATENLFGRKLSCVSLDILYMPVPSLSGSKYVLGISVVSANGFKLCYPCKSKSEVVSKLSFATKYLENITGEKITMWRLDKGGENRSKKFWEICLQAGVIVSETGTEEHESNGQIENWWKIALNNWRSHQIATNCDKRLWADGMCYMAYIHNRLVHHRQSKTPYEALTNQKPSLHDLKVFGCVAYAYVLKKNRPQGKLSPRGIPGIFIGLGYYDGHPIQQYGGYKVWHKEAKSLTVSCTRDVVFLEDKFVVESSSLGEGEEVRTQNHLNEDEADSEDDYDSGEIHDDPVAVNPVMEPENINGVGREEVENSNELDSDEDEEYASGEDGISEYVSGEENDLPITPQRRLRSTGPVGDWSKVLGETWGKLAHGIHNAQVYLSFPGPPLKVALNDENWRQAMKKEDQQMKDMGVYELVPPPPDKQILNSLWVLITKKDDDTGEEELKARWVVNGSKQIQGDTYDKAFAATPSMASYKTLLAIRTQRNMKTIHIDWSGAHLNSIQDYEVYVKQPRGFEEPGKEHWVRKLLKACYGEKQAAYLWELCRDSFLIDICGFERCPYDPCTFIKRFGEKYIICDVHADDAPFFFDQGIDAEMDTVIKLLQSRFKIKIQPRLQKHLAMRVDYGDDWTSVDQEAYCLSILDTFQEDPLDKCNTPWSTEIDEEFDKELDPNSQDTIYMRSRDYWGLVGKLQYLVNTRPDIGYTVSKLARKCARPRIVHWKAAQRALAYLRATSDMKLVFRKGEKFEPIIATNDELGTACYSDADFAGDKETRRSTTGIAIILCGATILASSKRQSVVADSTVAAETIALHSLVKEAVWLRNFLSWVGYTQKEPTKLYCDNRGAVRNCEDGAERHKTKHLDVKYMFIRDVVRQGLVRIKHIGTDHMVADILTKGLRRHRFEACRKGLGLMKGSVWDQVIKPGIIVSNEVDTI